MNHLKYCLKIILLTLIYLALAYSGYKYAPQYLHVTAIWFPYGMALAIYLIYGINLWPVSFLGSLLFTQIIGVPIVPALISATGDTLAPVFGVWVLHKICKINLKLSSFHDAIGLIIFGIFLPPLICGAVGVFSLYIGGLAPISKLPETMLVWWLSDVAGSMILTPLLISCLRHTAFSTERKYAKIELLILYSLLLVVSWILYMRGFDVQLSHMLPLYSNLIFTVWAALRFDLRSTMIATAISGLAALFGGILTLPQIGIYERGLNILHLQILTSSISSIGLILSAATRQQKEIAETLRKSMNEYLDSEHRLGLALEAASMGTWTWDIIKDYVVWSDQACKIYGVQKEEFNQKVSGFIAVIHEEDRETVRVGLLAFLDSNESYYSLEHRVMWPDGSVHWIEAKGRIYRDKAGKPIRMAGVVTDVTEMKEIATIRERLLTQEQKTRMEAEKSIVQRDEFLSIASHELKTPLTAVLLSIQMSIKQLSSDSPVLKNLHKAEASLNRFLKLVSNLLDVSRITAERLSLNPQRFDLSILLQESIERIRPEFTANETALTAEIKPNIEGEWDMIRIEQVFTNLLSNALKYGMGRPVIVKLTTNIDKAILTIQDQGIGIEEENLNKIFERFERVAPQRQYGGLGLGLYITRKIIDAHGGTISVQSEFEKGSTFKVELPIIH